MIGGVVQWAIGASRSVRSRRSSASATAASVVSFPSRARRAPAMAAWSGAAPSRRSARRIPASSSSSRIAAIAYGGPPAGRGAARRSTSRGSASASSTRPPGNTNASPAKAIVAGRRVSSTSGRRRPPLPAGRSRTTVAAGRGWDGGVASGFASMADIVGAAGPRDPPVHPGTVARFRVLFRVLRRRTVTARSVREGSDSGGWRESVMPRTTRRASVLLVVAAARGGLVAAPAASAADPAKGELAKTIVTFQGELGRKAQRIIEKYGGTVRAELGIVDGVSALIPKGQLKQLAKDPAVTSVEPDLPVTLFPMDHAGDTGDLEYENAWGVEHIGTPAVHAAGIRGAGVKVAVIDTGIDYLHDDPDDTPYVVDPEFYGNYKGGHDFVNNDDDPMDDNGHGTHVAGILAAEKNGYLVSGVAPDVDLYALKILNANGEGDESNLILALQWAVTHDIDVVNMSLGMHTSVPALATAVANASAAGVLLVAASGNVNPLSLNEVPFGCAVAYPAAYPQVLSTTFTNGNNALTGLSCTGPEVDFAAPGDQIYGPVPIGTCQLCDPRGYASLTGTSMASPHLAGTVALLLAAGITDTGTPGLLDNVKAQLCAHADVGFGVNTTPIGTSDARYPKDFGCGVLNADGAVPPLLGLAPPDLPPTAAPKSATATQPNPVTITLAGTDPDTCNLTFLVVDPPDHGSVGPISNVACVGSSPNSDT